MGLIVFSLVTLLLFIRVFEVYSFISRINKKCKSYDWSYVETNEHLLLDMISNKEYYINSEWSALNFLYLKGPNPILFFFSLKPLTIETQYDKEILEKLNRYEN